MKIHLLNYEKYAIDYLDGTLAPDLVEEMDLFLAQHSQIKAELNQMATATWPPLSHETYGDKSKLYRQSGLRTIYRWWSIAAAVMIFATTGWIYVYLSQPTESNLPAQVTLMNQVPVPSPTILPASQIPPAEIAEVQVSPRSPSPARSGSRLNPVKQELNPTDLPEVHEPISGREDKSPGSENIAIVGASATTVLLTDIAIAPAKTVRTEITFLPRLTFTALPVPDLSVPQAVASIPAKSTPPDVAVPFTPEAYSGLSQGGSLRNALIPEVLVGLFSKSK